MVIGCKPIEIHGEIHEFMRTYLPIPKDCVIASAFGAIISAEERLAIFSMGFYNGTGRLTKEIKNRRSKRDEALLCIPVEPEFGLTTQEEYCYFDTNQTGYCILEWICRRQGLTNIRENGVPQPNPPNVEFVVSKPGLGRDGELPWCLIVRASATIPANQFLMSVPPEDGCESIVTRKYK